MGTVCIILAIAYLLTPVAASRCEKIGRIRSAMLLSGLTPRLAAAELVLLTFAVETTPLVQAFGIVVWTVALAISAINCGRVAAEMRTSIAVRAERSEAARRRAVVDRHEVP